MNNPTFICARCHREFPMSARRGLDGRDYCSACLDAITAICRVCGTRRIRMPARRDRAIALTAAMSGS